MKLKSDFCRFYLNNRIQICTITDPPGKTALTT